MTVREKGISGTLRSFSKHASLTITAIGGLALWGWIFDIQSLKSVIPGLATMKANTAILFILAGVALNLKVEEKAGSIITGRAAQVCSFIITALAMITLGEYIFRQDFFIDQLIFRDPQTSAPLYPGRMSVTTAINFMLLGTALLTLNLETRQKIRPAQFLALLGFAIASIALTGYLYGVESLYSVGIYSSMALHTALGFAILSIGVLCARPKHGIMAVVTSDTAGGASLRRLLPIAVFILVVIGWLRLSGQRAGLYDTNFGLALMVMLSAASLCTVIWLNATWLNRIDSERRSAVDLLDSSEERFRLVVEAAPSAMITVDGNGNINLVNRQAQKLFGYAKEELLGHPIEMLVPGRFRGGHVNHRQSFFAEPASRAMGAGRDLFGLHKDGQEIPIEIGLTPYESSDGPSTLALIVDITERKRAEEALKYSEERLHAIIEQSPLSIQVFSPDGTYIRANPAWEKLWGARREQLIGYNILADPQVKARGILPYLERAFAGELVIAPPVYYDPADIGQVGTPRWTTAVIYPVKDTAGQIREVVLSHEDITERRQVEEALRIAHAELESQVQERTAALSEANSLLQTLMDNMPDHIYFKDADGRFIKNSRSQAKMMGSDPAEVIGKTDFDFFPKEHAQRSFDDEQKLVRSDLPSVNIEERVVWPDGRVTWVSTTKLPLRDMKDKIVGTFGISRDITARKQAEEELQRSNAQLEAANKELEAFSYSVSHDLRAPLRTIDGFSQAIIEDYGKQLSEQGRDDLMRVRKAAQHMAQLIDDLLNLSKVTRAPLKSETVNLSKLAQSIIDELKRSQPGHKVKFKNMPNLNVRCDPRLLQVALENLLNNAWKFTSRREHPEIELGSKRENDETIYFIRDNGAGFDMAYAGKLFGAFQRLHAMTDFPGTGVGLATVQRIIHRHGGRIWAKAQVDHGATFFFTLPASERAKPRSTLKEKDSIVERAKEII